MSICSSPAFADGKIISPADKHIQYIGRWDKSDEANYHSHWGGAYINIKLSGDELKIKLAARVNIYVKVDDGSMVLFKKVSGWVKITPDSLAAGEHHIQVIAKFQDDEIQLQGICLNETGKLLKVDKKNVLIEFIGDSITSGDKTSQGNTTAYPWLCGELLNARHTQISYCGISLTSGFHFNYKNAPQSGMDSAYFNLKQPNKDDNSIWDFKNYVPKLIVINLGTNDETLKVPAKDFQQRYTTLIKSVRSIFPKSIITIVIPFKGSYENEIKQMVEISFQKDKQLKIINTKGWLEQADFVDGTHPTDAGHKIIADKLSVILKTYLK